MIQTGKMVVYEWLLEEVRENVFGKGSIGEIEG